LKFVGRIGDLVAEDAHTDLPTRCYFAATIDVARLRGEWRYDAVV
jgi:hypothetical protein